MAMESLPLTVDTIAGLLQYRASLRAEHTAYKFLTLEGQDESVTWRELHLAATQIAAHVSRFATCGDRIVLLYRSTRSFVEAFFGCLYAGLVVVPAYELSEDRFHRTLARYRQMVSDASPVAVLADNESIDLLKRDKETTQTTPLVSLSLRSEQATFQHPPRHAFDPVLIQYTSGSTALPRGVVLTNRNILTNEALIADAHAHDESSTILSWVPIAHDWGLINGVLQPLYIGGLGVLMTPRVFLKNPLRWLEEISRHQRVTSGGPPFAYDLCVQRMSRLPVATLDLSSWRCAGVAAEPIRPDILEGFARTFTMCGFDPSSFYVGYGLAEATLFVSETERGHTPRIISINRSCLERGAVVLQPHDQSTPARRLVSCGIPPKEVTVKIVDCLALAPCSSDTVGEIWVAGESVSEAYWNRPDESVAVLNARLPDDHRSYLRTGDLGFIHDDHLYIAGRCSDVMVVRGRNVFPEDVEFAIDACHMSMRPGGTAVFGMSIEDREVLVVVQELRDATDTDFDAVIAKIRSAVWAECNIAPSAVALVEKGSIPRTSSGKPRRRECRRLYLNGSLPFLSNYVAPRVDWLKARAD